MSLMRTQSKGRSSGMVGVDRSLQRVKSISLSRLKMRQQSYGFSGVSGIRITEKTSAIALEFKRPPLVYQPTFQLDPYYRFHVESVTKIVDSILDVNFTNHKYNVQESPALALRLAGETMRAIKAMGFNRYRIIAVVTIGQRRAQSFNNAVAFTWDHERDNYVEVHRETPTAFIQIIVFGVYLD